MKLNSTKSNSPNPMNYEAMGHLSGPTAIQSSVVDSSAVHFLIKKFAPARRPKLWRQQEFFILSSPKIQTHSLWEEVTRRVLANSGD